MKYLSLFTGIGGFEYGLHRVFGDKAVCVGFSEINHHAISIYKSHYPLHVNIGDIECADLPECDLVFGGSPCQDLSSMGSGKGLDGDKSRLFYAFLSVIKRLKPRYFILENTASMSHNNRDIISGELGVQPVLIDASWFGAQKRRRLFWANFPINTAGLQASPIRLVQELDPVSPERPLAHSEAALAWLVLPFRGSNRLVIYAKHSETQHVPTVLASYAKGAPNNVLIDTRYSPLLIRAFSVQEIERLQGLPGWIPATTPRTAALRCLGNAVHGDVATYIFHALLLAVD